MPIYLLSSVTQKHIFWVSAPGPDKNQHAQLQKLALRERLRTHKVFTNDQSFYLNYHKFSIKSYVVDVYSVRRFLYTSTTYDFVEKY